MDDRDLMCSGGGKRTWNTHTHTHSGQYHFLVWGRVGSEPVVGDKEEFCFGHVGQRGSETANLLQGLCPAAPSDGTRFPQTVTCPDRHMPRSSIIPGLTASTTQAFPALFSPPTLCCYPILFFFIALNTFRNYIVTLLIHLLPILVQ